MSLNHAMLGTMLQYQEKLNDVFDPAWRTNRHSYLRAAAVECAELVDDYEHHGLRSAMVECSKLIEHSNYKWWKKPSRDEQQLKSDLKRILTEMLSTFTSPAALKASWAEEPTEIQFDGTTYQIQEMPGLELMDLLMGLCAQGRVSFALYRAVCRKVLPEEACPEINAEDPPEFKTGRKSQMDIKQMMLEVVDMAHFLLSEIARAENEPEAARLKLLSLWGDETATIQFDGQSYSFDAMDASQRMDLMVALCCARKINFELYRRIMQDIGLSFGSLYRMYAAKNVLNLFRQHNGDKQGTYIKIWMGREDNVYLADLMETWTEEEGMDVLYARLKDCYVELALGGQA